MGKCDVQLSRLHCLSLPCLHCHRWKKFVAICKLLRDASTDGSAGTESTSNAGEKNARRECPSEIRHQDDREEFREGKSPMTPELYTSLLRWFLQWGTVEGIYCAYYVCQTWQLACRSNNTGRIKFSHMQWQHLAWVLIADSKTATNIQRANKAT